MRMIFSFSFTRRSTPAETGALGRGLIRMILSYPILFCFTCLSTPAKTGAQRQGAYTYVLFLFVYLPKSPCKSWGSSRAVYTSEPRLF